VGRDGASDAPSIVRSAIRERGLLSYAEFMELALYDPEAGYYARGARQSGSTGDFVTSVDIGPLFGEMLAVQFAEMWRRLGEPAVLDLVEAGASDGRLARDVLDAASSDPPFYAALRLHLVERSPAARAVERDTLAPHAARLASVGPTLPDRFEGILVANELLDALPVHVVVMRESGLREVFVDLEGDRLVEREAQPSTPRLEAYFAGRGPLQPGWRTEVNLAAVDWVRAAASRLARGFMLLVDYGHRNHTVDARVHSTGTLRSYRRHRVHATGEGRAPWLTAPGACDMTTGVDFAAICAAAEGEGLTVLGLPDQMHFLLGLGIAERVARPTGHPPHDLARRLALKTLTLPDGFGASHKVLVLSRHAGAPDLSGLRFASRPGPAPDPRRLEVD